MAGLASAAGAGVSAGSPEAAAISRSSSSSLGRPAIWSTKTSDCCEGISNRLPQDVHVTSSSTRSR